MAVVARVIFIVSHSFSVHDSNIARSHSLQKEKHRLISCFSSRNCNHQTYNKELPLASTRAQMQMSAKHNLVLCVDQDLVEKTRELGFNLSKTFENHLKQ